MILETFFLAIGIPWVIGKCVSDSNYHKRNVAAQNDRFAWARAKMQELSPPEKEMSSIQGLVGIKGNIDACTEIKDVLIDVFGADYKEKMTKEYAFRPYKESAYDYNVRGSFWLRQLVLAKRGYIDPERIITGIDIPTNDSTYTYSVKMCRHIERMLAEAGHPEMKFYASEIKSGPFPKKTLTFLSPGYVALIRSGRIRLQADRLW